MASKDGYEDSFLPRSSFTGAPEEALGCACGLYLNDVSTWAEARRDGDPDHATTCDEDH